MLILQKRANIMSLDTYVKGMPREEGFHAAYAAFNRFREAVADAFDHEIGVIYKKRWVSIEDAVIWNAKISKPMEEFLLHSDCSGKFTYKQCKDIYNELNKLSVDFIYVCPYNGDVNFNMLEHWKNIFKYCWKHRLTLWFR